MKIGVIKEIKDKENRVALTPAGARQLINDDHTVLVENDAGIGSGFVNAEYEAEGASIVQAKEAWATDLVLKVKEPLEQEYPYLSGNILFTYLHLAGVNPSLTEHLLKAGTTAVAYETVEDEDGRFPLLAPMSAIAGNMAVSIGGYYLAKTIGGKGVQLGSVLGERHGKVVVVGNGTVGMHSAFTADGMGANVYLFGRNMGKFQRIELTLRHNLRYIESTPETVAEQVRDADLVVGAVLLPGAKAPWVVTEEMVKSMQPGSVIVDVSIDQGGCVETSHATSHSDPVFIKHDVVHYCVTNMPGAYPRTATIALTNATLPYIKRIADEGIAALEKDTEFAHGLNTYQGKITCKPAAESLDKMDQYQKFKEEKE